MRKFKGYKMEVIHQERGRGIVKYESPMGASTINLNRGDFLIVMRKKKTTKKPPENFPKIFVDKAG
jgi:hypothetical protein